MMPPPSIYWQCDCGRTQDDTACRHCGEAPSTGFIRDCLACVAALGIAVAIIAGLAETPQARAWMLADDLAAGCAR